MKTALQYWLNGWTVENAGWYAVIGLALLAGTAIVGVLLVICLPANFFSPGRVKQHDLASPKTWTFLITRNLMGGVLIVLGIAMLVLPGPGLLTLVIGLMLLSIPGKRQLAAKLIKRTGLLKAANRWRVSLGRKPLLIPGRAGGTGCA